ncbi:hypothetical protein [Kocuria sp. NPDC057446]|uniref:arsenate reductase/protein-tyrosine-phosphatase family protein n=1 Tax=Kocuria sp. NPDC057446 TaxID=3346137 RepID=UPI00367EFE95
MDTARTGNREATPFLVRAQHADGTCADIRASAVIDASGNWSTPNPLGQAGLPAPGEAAVVAAGRITAPLPDVTDRDRDRSAGRHVLVVGAGHSAATTLLELGALAETEPGTGSSWAVRSADVTGVYGGEDRDELAARGAPGTRLRHLVESGAIEVHTSFSITGFTTNDDGLSVRNTTPTGEQQLEVDRLVPATGYEQVHPLVVDALRERVIDLSGAYPKPLTDDVVRAADYVFTMGCGDACPVHPGKRYPHWSIVDPSQETSDGVRVIVEAIDARVQTLWDQIRN